MSKENAKLKKWMKITPFFENYMKKKQKKIEIKNKERNSRFIERRNMDENKWSR